MPHVLAPRHPAHRGTLHQGARCQPCPAKTACTAAEGGGKRTVGSPCEPCELQAQSRSNGIGCSSFEGSSDQQVA